MKYAEVTSLYKHGVIDGFNALREPGEKIGWRLEILLDDPQGNGHLRDYLESQRKGVRVFKTLDALLSEVERIKGDQSIRLAVDPVELDESYELK